MPEATETAAPKLSAKEIADQLGTEGLKAFLLDPEVMKIRATNPSIIKKENEMSAEERKIEEAKVKDELERIAYLFEPKFEYSSDLANGITKIGTTVKPGSSTIYANFKRDGRADVLKTVVSKNNITEKQYARRCELARMYMMEAATKCIASKVNLEQQ